MGYTGDALRNTRGGHPQGLVSQSCHTHPHARAAERFRDCPGGVSMKRCKGVGPEDNEDLAVIEGMVRSLAPYERPGRPAVTQRYAKPAAPKPSRHSTETSTLHDPQGRC